MNDGTATQSRLLQEIRQMAATQRKAILRSLMPQIDAAVNHGVTYSEISKRLAAAGIELAPESLRQARYRWRKRPTSVASESVPDTTPTRPPLSANEASKPMPSERIHSKADLVRLRTSSESIDLTQLAELGRQQ
ncbi:hypothetical protein [Achromobacter aegrifaciens]|uniref:Uncharacterized protein n=1 Tax=Achromobacter aegrifaciens TaxID=1287736 RepID=A0ABU2DK24_ACHAE|nr:hypothetical protein [Achromobacter aegrifaciens]MDR7948287.1 hypothetical protein [Achromobacter aegrifaciens]